MTAIQISKPDRAAGDRAALGRLFVLDVSGRRVFSVNPDGSDRKILVTDCPLPDGVVVDAEAGHLYWTNMGVPSLNDGSIERADLDGQNRTTLVPEAATFTPKQLQLDKANGLLYWTDRGDPPRGNTVNRAPVDAQPGRAREPEIVFTHLMEGIGIALDVRGDRMFMTDFGGSVYSARLDGSEPHALLFGQGNLT